MAAPNSDNTSRADDADAGSTTAANRRLFERHPVNHVCQVTETDAFGNPGISWECRIVDLSRSGIGLRSRRMSYEGRYLLIEFQSGSEVNKVLFGIVRQSRYSEGEGYAIGVEFRALPKGSAFRNWLSQRGHDIRPT